MRTLIKYSQFPRAGIRRILRTRYALLTMFYETLWLCTKKISNIKICPMCRTLATQVFNWHIYIVGRFGTTDNGWSAWTGENPKNLQRRSCWLGLHVIGADNVTAQLSQRPKSLTRLGGWRQRMSRARALIRNGLPFSDLKKKKKKSWAVTAPRMWERAAPFRCFRWNLVCWGDDKALHRNRHDIDVPL